MKKAVEPKKAEKAVEKVEVKPEPKVAKPKADKPKARGHFPVPEKILAQVIKQAKQAEPKVIPTEVQVMGGAYKLSALMVTLGFPAFAHDAPRLFEKGIVSVDGEVVTADADYHVGNIVITKDEQSFRVIGMVLTAPK